MKNHTTLRAKIYKLTDLRGVYRRDGLLSSVGRKRNEAIQSLIDDYGIERVFREVVALTPTNDVSRAVLLRHYMRTPDVGTVRCAMLYAGEGPRLRAINAQVEFCAMFGWKVAA